MFGPEYDEIKRAIPGDNAAKSSAPEMLAEAVRRLANPAPRVLDFGCGDGRGVDTLHKIAPAAKYVGVDIEGSPEVTSRLRGDAEFHSYNGTDLPFADASFDAVYSNQVFEHVRHPDRVMAEICRVLRPGGFFAGSVSNLEPYHSYSIFNYTPYGLFRVAEDNGLTLEAMRPGPEGVGMIVRQLTMRALPGFPLAYPLVGLLGLVRRLGAREKNYLKLRFSGHICFLASRPPG